MEPPLYLPDAFAISIATLACISGSFMACIWICIVAIITAPGPLKPYLCMVAIWICSTIGNKTIIFCVGSGPHDAIAFSNRSLFSGISNAAIASSKAASEHILQSVAYENHKTDTFRLFK